MWENATPGTEIPHIFCAVIGPLQLGVVLVILCLNFVTRVIQDIHFEIMVILHYINIELVNICPYRVKNKEIKGY